MGGPPNQPPPPPPKARKPKLSPKIASGDPVTIILSPCGKYAVKVRGQLSEDNILDLRLDERTWQFVEQYVADGPEDEDCPGLAKNPLELRYGSGFGDDPNPAFNPPEWEASVVKRSALEHYERLKGLQLKVASLEASLRRVRDQRSFFRFLRNCKKLEEGGLPDSEEEFRQFVTAGSRYGVEP
jgi:hypothetical protein